jgi:hypothetical protein
VIRKLGQERGGEKIELPKTLQELLDTGGPLLRFKRGLKAIKVREHGTFANVPKVEAIQDGEVVYLTTEEDEKQF